MPPTPARAKAAPEDRSSTALSFSMQPQNYDFPNVSYSPEKRPRFPDTAEQLRYNSRASSTVSDLPSSVNQEREASTRNLLYIWSQLGRYSKSLGEDDIIDLSTGELVKDRGVLRSMPESWEFGRFADLYPEAGGSLDQPEDEDEESADELDTLTNKEDSEVSLRGAVGRFGTLDPNNPEDLADIEEFMQAEERRKQECGEDSEGEETFEDHYTTAREEQTASDDGRSSPPVLREFSPEVPEYPLQDNDSSSEDELLANLREEEDIQPVFPQRDKTPLPSPLLPGISRTRHPVQLQTPPLSHTSSTPDITWNPAIGLSQSPSSPIKSSNTSPRRWSSGHPKATTTKSETPSPLSEGSIPLNAAGKRSPRGRIPRSQAPITQETESKESHGTSSAAGRSWIGSISSAAAKGKQKAEEDEPPTPSHQRRRRLIRSTKDAEDSLFLPSVSNAGPSSAPESTAYEQLNSDNRPPSPRKRKRRESESEIQTSNAFVSPGRSARSRTPAASTSRETTRSSGGQGRSARARNKKRLPRGKASDKEINSDEESATGEYPQYSDFDYPPHVYPSVPQSFTPVPLYDPRAQMIISHAVHQLSALFTVPSHSQPYYPPFQAFPPISPIYHTPHRPSHHSQDPRFSHATLPPSSDIDSSPESSNRKPRGSSIVTRSRSRGRRVSFVVDNPEDSGGSIQRVRRKASRTYDSDPFVCTSDEDSRSHDEGRSRNERSSSRSQTPGPPSSREKTVQRRRSKSLTAVDK